MSRCVTCQTIDAAKSKGTLEGLCRFYASEVARLQSQPTPDGDVAVAEELDGLRRGMAALNQTIAARNLTIENLRKAKA